MNKTMDGSELADSPTGKITKFGLKLGTKRGVSRKLANLLKPVNAELGGKPISRGQFRRRDSIKKQPKPVI